MKTSIKTSRTTAIALVILMMASIMLIGISPVNAQPSPEQPGVTIPSGATDYDIVDTIPHVSFRPRTIGVGQSLLVNMWIEATYLQAQYQFFQAYKVTITKPDGTQDVITKDSYVADTTSWFEYVPDQIGEWTVKLDFLGQYFPNGTYWQGVVYPNVAAIGSQIKKKAVVFFSLFTGNGHSFVSNQRGSDMYDL